MTKWKSILIVATHLQFQSIRDRAIQELTETASFVDKIVLGRSLDIEHWLMPAFVGLAQHPDPLTIDEGRSLGLEAVVHLAAAREQYLKSMQAQFMFTREMFGL